MFNLLKNFKQQASYTCKKRLPNTNRQMGLSVNTIITFTRLVKLVSPVLLLCTFSQIKAQSPADICESVVPASWSVSKNQSLAVDTAFAKIGRQSVRWNWNAGGQLQITDSSLQQILNNPRSMFTCWLYNPAALNDSIVFVFEKDGKGLCSFSFGLNFTGWRAGWLLYHHDMKGILKANPGRLVIKAPASRQAGVLFLDQLQMVVTGDPRSPIPDYQLPYVQKDVLQAANAHWSALYPFSRYPHIQKFKKEMRSTATAGTLTIQSRLDSMLLDAEKTKKTFEQLFARYNIYQIKKTGTVVTGLPLFSPQQLEVISGLSADEKKQWFETRDIKKFHELLLDIALAYRKQNNAAEKNNLAGLFLNMLNHLETQGWAYGSGQGVLHHLGYNFKDFYPACFLMRDVLKDSSLLARTYKTMFWYSGLGRTRLAAQHAATSNIDVFNTQTPGMLYTAMMVPSADEKIISLKEFSNWLSYNLYPTYSLDGTLKPDGAVFHHANLYPAYGIGGFASLAPIVYAISHTSFQIDDKAFSSLAKAMYMMAVYCEYNHWPISVSGRHPNGEWEMDSKAYAFMALANPATKKDTTMAAVFLKTSYKKNEQGLKRYITQKIKSTPYTYPQAHWNMNYGLLDIHRRNNWLLTVRGHNRYFVANESYPGANMFGRYISYGHLEILYPAARPGLNSGFADKGWDWNHFPGITAPYLPLDSLRAKIINADKFSGIEEMLLTDELFAGGTNWQQKHGLFAMKLHGHDKYNEGGFRARKSWFMFDSTVICLGSNIQFNSKQHPVHTTVYQEVVDTINKSITAEYSTSSQADFISSRGINYYFPPGQQVILSREMRNSRNQKDAAATKGAVEQLYFNHGALPVNARYEYAINIPSKEEWRERTEARPFTFIPNYKVLNKDSLAHIVNYLPENIIAAAFFEKSKWQFDEVLKAVNNPCLLMYQLQEKNLEISITDPDLRFYEGKDDVPLDENGKRKEVSIYSRKWIASPSKPGTVIIEVSGSWQLVSSTETVKTAVTKNGGTLLTILCKYGEATIIKLKKQQL